MNEKIQKAVQEFEVFWNSLDFSDASTKSYPDGTIITTGYLPEEKHEQAKANATLLSTEANRLVSEYSDVDSTELMNAFKERLELFYRDYL